jgi:hypothetical protein
MKVKTMNAKQKIIIQIGILLVLLMGLVPPWIKTIHLRNIQRQMSEGYHFIFSPPNQTCGLCSVEIDIPRLLGEWFIIGIVALALFQYFKNK